MYFDIDIQMLYGLEGLFRMLCKPGGTYELRIINDTRYSGSPVEG